MVSKKIEELELENAILKAKLEMLERMYQESIRMHSSREPVDTDALLSRLTQKQHAVMVAFFGGQSYDDIAGHMGVDVTTVKLHLKAACANLGAHNRSHLLNTWGPVINSISAESYSRQFHVTKDWWIRQPQLLMEQLRTKRSTLYRAKPASTRSPAPKRAASAAQPTPLRRKPK
jgi:DNA-binding CsgD family transcriptional regulator